MSHHTASTPEMLLWPILVFLILPCVFMSHVDGSSGSDEDSVSATSLGPSLLSVPALAALPLPVPSLRAPLPAARVLASGHPHHTFEAFPQLWSSVPARPQGFRLGPTRLFLARPQPPLSLPFQKPRAPAEGSQIQVDRPMLVSEEHQG